jgi:hypothetical protein
MFSAGTETQSPVPAAFAHTLSGTTHQRVLETGFYTFDVFDYAMPALLRV